MYLLLSDHRDIGTFQNAAGGSLYGEVDPSCGDMSTIDHIVVLDTLDRV